MLTQRDSATAPGRPRIVLAALLCIVPACSNAPDRHETYVPPGNGGDSAIGGGLGTGASPVAGVGGQLAGAGGQLAGTGGQLAGAGGQLAGAGGQLAGTGGQVAGTGGQVAGAGGQLAGAGGQVTGGAGMGGAGMGGAAGGVGGSAGGGTGGVAGAGGIGGGTGGTMPDPTGPVVMADAAHVRLLPGSPFYDRQELHRRGYLASLDPDTLLYEYRKLANLPQANGVTSGYAGWDTGFIKGHLTGHYLSAASRMAVATGDSSFEGKVDYTVAELAKCQAALGNSGYLAAFPSVAFDWLEGTSSDSGGVVVPYYTVHKIMAGLLDAYRYLGNQQALEITTRMADYFQARLGGLPPDTIERIFRTDGSGNPQNEFGAMSDALSQLYATTGQQSYLDAAKVFNRSWFIDPLAGNEDHLEGLHGNTHIAEALGIAHTAVLSQDAIGIQASENFWTMMAEQHSFVNGGNSFREWLDQAGVEAGSSIDEGKVLPATTAETCNTHNMLKLTTVLFERDPRIEYADYYERALYNHILASVAPDTGEMTYFTPMYGHFRTYINGTYCDTGTGIENTPRYNEGIYFEKGSSLWVNLYIPSELAWDDTGLTVRLEGNAAAGEQVHITIVDGGPATQATFFLRIPFWVSGAPELTVNGSALEQSLSPGSYVPISRQWAVGDVVTLTLPTSLRLEHARDVPSMVSVFHGPILLAGELGSTGMPNDFADKDAYLGTAPAAVPAVATSSSDSVEWLQPLANTPLAFEASNAGPATGITFRPLYEVHHQRYSVYWPLTSP